MGETSLQTPESHRWKYLFILVALTHLLTALIYLFLGTGKHQTAWFKKAQVVQDASLTPPIQAAPQSKPGIFRAKHPKKSKSFTKLFESSQAKVMIPLNDVQPSSVRHDIKFSRSHEATTRPQNSLKNSEDGTTPHTKHLGWPFKRAMSFTSSVNFSFNSGDLLSETADSYSVASTNNLSPSNHSATNFSYDSDFKDSHRHPFTDVSLTSNEVISGRVRVPKSCCGKTSPLIAESLDEDGGGVDADQFGKDANSGDDGGDDRKGGDGNDFKESFTKKSAESEVSMEYREKAELSGFKATSGNKRNKRDANSGDNTKDLTSHKNSLDDSNDFNLEINDSDISESNV